MNSRGRWLGLLVLAGAVALMLRGAFVSSGPEVVVYTAQDRPFAETIFEQFTRETGIRVQPAFDTEATKTVGLALRIMAEEARPRCDLFWNNEILNTLRLEQKGLLAPLPAAALEPFPPSMRSGEGLWCGFAARARILIVNTELLAEGERPTSIEALTDGRYRGKCAIAKPLFGTTATQAACLFAAWGSERAEAYFERLKANDVQVLAGNKHVAQAVAAGQVLFGLTDTDDAVGEIEQGRAVAIVYPDQGEGETGTLFIPNTLARIKGGPNPEGAARLADFLLSPEVERRLAAGPSAQIPLNPAVEPNARVKTPREVRAMEVDWQAAAAAWDQAATFLRDRFTAP